MKVTHNMTIVDTNYEQRILAYTKAKTQFTFFNEISLSTQLDELGFDSLSIVDFVIGLEEEFGIRIPDNTALSDNVRTIQNLCDLVVELDCQKAE